MAENNPNGPVAYMMLGLPGSGKTTFSKKLADDLGLSRFSLDEEYFGLVGNTQQVQRDFEVEADVSRRIQDRVKELLVDSQSVVLDFCPWKFAVRQEYYDFITTHGGRCKVYYFDVPKPELLRRLTLRNESTDATNQFMTPQMLEDFITDRFDVPKPDEHVEVIDE
jgi:predicted kinase